MAFTNRSRPAAFYSSHQDHLCHLFHFHNLPTPGKARCTNKITECAEQGIPANPPMMMPMLSLKVNRPRTKALIKELELRYWPTDEEDQEELFDKFEQSLVDLRGGLRTLSNAEDG
jgi:hypothetical protein